MTPHPLNDTLGDPNGAGHVSLRGGDGYAWIEGDIRGEIPILAEIGWISKF